jgi:hypothetical protein
VLLKRKSAPTWQADMAQTTRVFGGQIGWQNSCRLASQEWLKWGRNRNFRFCGTAVSNRTFSLHLHMPNEPEPEQAAKAFFNQNNHCLSPHLRLASLNQLKLRVYNTSIYNSY